MEIIDDQPESNSTDHELDGMRIRQLATLRRATIRARSWWLIAAGICFVGAVQLLIDMSLAIRRNHAWSLRATVYMVIAALSLRLTRLSLLRAKMLKREIDRPMLDEPDTPPDFSGLNDGSQRWKNLEDIQ